MDEYRTVLINILLICLLLGALGYSLKKNLTFSLRSQGFKKIRKEREDELIAVEDFALNTLMNMDIPKDTEVIAYQPNNFFWNGRAEYIVRRVEQIMSTAHFCLICNVSCLPVRVGTYPMKWYGGIAMREDGEKHSKEDRSSIVFAINVMGDTRQEIDDLVSHECAHLLVCDIKSDVHGEEFKFYYAACKDILLNSPIDFPK